MVSARLLVGIVAALMAHLGTAQNSDTAASGDTDTLSPSETEPEPQPPHNREHRRDPQNTTAPPAQPTPDPTDIKPSELDPVSPTIINAESPHESKAASTHTTAPAAGNGSPSVVPLVSPGVSLLSVPAPASASPSAAAPVNLTTWTYNYTVDRNSPMFPLAWIRLPPENSSQSSETTSRPQLGATGLGGVGFSEAFSPTSSAVPQPPTSLAPQENQIVNRHARRQVSQSEAVSNSTFSFTGTGVTVKGEGSFILKTGDGTEKRFDAAETNVTLGQRVEDYTLSLDSPNSTVTQLIVHSMSEIDQDAGSPFCENITLAEGSNLKSAAWLILTGSVRVQDGAAMLESASSMTIKLPDSASRVALYGITDPSFGTYVASSSAVVDGGKSTGSAQRERADDVLYSDISFTPRAKLSNSLILRSTGGRVGVNKFQICYASRARPDDALSSTTSSSGSGGGKKSNIGAIVGGVVGGLAFLIIVGGLFFWLRRRKRSKEVPAYQTVRAFTGGASLEAAHTTKEMDNSPISTTGSHHYITSGTAAGDREAGLLAAPVFGAELSNGRSDSRVQPLSGDGHGNEGDALPTYNTDWKSTASGDVKKPRGFVARRPSQVSLATTSSTMSSDSDEDEDNNNTLRANQRKSTSKKRASSSKHQM